MNEVELTNDEKSLLAELERVIRSCVWNGSSKVFEGQDESDGSGSRIR
jgi:hypothetical protein